MNGSGAEKDVVLTGLSGRLPESESIEEFAQQLFDGVDLVTADGRRWTPGMCTHLFLLLNAVIGNSATLCLRVTSPRPLAVPAPAQSSCNR